MAGTDINKLKELMAADGYPVSPDGQVWGVDYESYRKWVLANVLNKDGWTFADVKNQWEALHLSAFVPAAIAADVAIGPVMNVPLSGSAVGENGYLLTGQGNPASGFVLVNGTNCQAALSIRYTQNLRIPSPDSTGAFSIPATDANGNEWAFAYSLSAETLADYDVTLSVSLDPTGASSAALVWTLDGTNFVSEDTESITDNTVSEDGTTVQNIQRYSFDWIKSHLLPPANTQAVPSGSFVISLSVVAKDGSDSAVVSVPVRVHATGDSGTSP